MLSNPSLRSRDEQPTPQKHITIISAVLAILSIYQIIYNFSYVKEVVQDLRYYFYFNSILKVILLLLLPIATYLFWRRIRSGWPLLCLYLTYMVCGVVVGIIGVIGNFPTMSFLPSPFFVVIVKLMDESPTMWSILSGVTRLLDLLFFGVMLVVICSRGIRDLFAIDKRVMLMTILSVVLITLIQWWWMLRSEY